MSTRAIIVTDDTFKRFTQIKNRMKKPHQKADDYIVGKAFDALENKSTILHEEIEEGELQVNFPSGY